MAALPHPRIAVLLGGESQAFPPDAASAFGAELAALAKESGGALLITPSRRTRPDSLARLSGAIADVPHVWDGAGDNPYFALLGLADAIVVTEDSVNMVTEAAGTGKPVYVQAAGPLGADSPASPLMRSAARPGPSRGDSRSSYAPINDTEMVAAAIRRALGLEIKG